MTSSLGATISPSLRVDASEKRKCLIRAPNCFYEDMFRNELKIAELCDQEVLQLEWEPKIGDKFFVRESKAFDRALELDPKYAYNWQGKGMVLARLGQLEEALIAYQKALTLFTNENNIKMVTYLNDPIQAHNLKGMHAACHSKSHMLQNI